MASGTETLACGIGRTAAATVRLHCAVALSAALVFAVLCFSPIYVATARAEAEGIAAEVTAIAESLRDDLGNATRLMPTPEQVAAIAATDADAEMLLAYVTGLYAQLPAGQSAAKPGQTEILIEGPALSDLPGGYTEQAARFRPGTEFYGFKYVEPGSTLGMSYDGLVKVAGEWVFIPKAWRAFR